jgi:hypothetical protein
MDTQAYVDKAKAQLAAKQQEIQALAEALKPLHEVAQAKDTAILFTGQATFAEAFIYGKMSCDVQCSV